MNIRYGRGLRFGSAVLLAVLGCAVAMADERLQWHGFAALSAVKTDRNAFFGDSEDLSFDFREAGINASYRLNSRVLLSGQVLSRRAGELYDGSPQVDYALVNVTLAESLSNRTALHLGRIKNPLGLYNATRDVPCTRPGIFLPQSLYFDKTRNTMLATDGVMLSSQWRTGRGDISFDIGAGRPLVDKNFEWAMLGLDFPGKLDPGWDALVAALWYHSPDERLRLGISGLSAKSDYEPGGGFDLQAGELSVNMALLSAQYDWYRWSLAAEYLYLPLRWENFGPLMPFDESNGESYYLQGMYRPRRDIELMARWERGVTDRDDRGGFAQAERALGLLPHFDFYDRSWTFGATWHVSRHLMLRGEYSQRSGTYVLSSRENLPEDLSRKWHIFAAQIALRF